MAPHYQSTDDKVQHPDTHDGEPVDLQHSPDATEASSGLGFNGELTEAGTGWQLLGNGYRAYNPALMRFHSPDNLSPFGEGGVNAYAYCEGDPVNLVDPSGHSWWSGIVRAAGRGLGRFRVRAGTRMTSTSVGDLASVSQTASRASSVSESSSQVVSTAANVPSRPVAAGEKTPSWTMQAFDPPAFKLVDNNMFPPEPVRHVVQIRRRGAVAYSEVPPEIVALRARHSEAGRGLIDRMRRLNPFARRSESAPPAYEPPPSYKEAVKLRRRH